MINYSNNHYRCISNTLRCCLLENAHEKDIVRTSIRKWRHAKVDVSFNHSIQTYMNEIFELFDYQRPVSSKSERAPQRIEYLFDVLSSEAFVLNRLLYKNHNQHRNSQFFSKIREVRKGLRTIEKIGIDSLFSELFKTTKTFLELLKKSRIQMISVPSRGYCLFCCRRLYGSFLVLTNVISVLEKCGQALLSFLGQGSFLPLGVVCLSIISRSHYILKEIVLVISKCYELVLKTSYQLPDDPELAIKYWHRMSIPLYSDLPNVLPSSCDSTSPVEKEEQERNNDQTRKKNKRKREPKKKPTSNEMNEMEDIGEIIMDKPISADDSSEQRRNRDVAGMNQKEDSSFKRKKAVDNMYNVLCMQ